MEDYSIIRYYPDLLLRYNQTNRNNFDKIEVIGEVFEGLLCAGVYWFIPQRVRCEVIGDEIRHDLSHIE